MKLDILYIQHEIYTFLNIVRCTSLAHLLYETAFQGIFKMRHNRFGVDSFFGQNAIIKKKISKGLFCFNAYRESSTIIKMFFT